MQHSTKPYMQDSGPKVGALKTQKQLKNSQKLFKLSLFPKHQSSPGPALLKCQEAAIRQKRRRSSCPAASSTSAARYAGEVSKGEVASWP